MTPKRITRSTPTTTTTTTAVTNAQIKALIDQGIFNSLTARDADRSMNGDDSHNSGTGVRRTERVAHIVMLDSEDSTVTYTAVSSPFGSLSDIGSPGVDRQPVMPEDPYAYVVAAFQAPPFHDYVFGLEEPEQTPPSLEFVPEPVYPRFMPLEDEVFPAEEQPLLAVVLPTTDSQGYIADSDLEEDKEDPKEDPTDYPAYGGDDDDDDESSDDDEDDDDDVEEDKEEEHPASADSIPPPVHRVTARMSIQDEPPIPFWFEAEIARLL
ncbi:hypothetical protein Tco_0428905, partial [Tanacetum coccineum]